MPKRDHPLHGLLVVDKPGQHSAKPSINAGAPSSVESAPTFQPYSFDPTRLPTSHDIVQMVRRWSGQRQIGHTGTLDPMASGVLMLCLGNATRLVEYYQGQPKQYYAEVVLGSATDTYDALGEVIATSAVPVLGDAMLEAALQQFRGPILQSPPIYSALKQDGESLHRKARRGETVVVTPRPITFYQIDLVNWQPPDRVCLRITCSAGAYIRSLAYDLGLALQTQAHLALLRRAAVGRFTLDEAHDLATIEQAARQGVLHELLLPLGFGLGLPILQLDEEQVRRFGHGQKVILNITPSLTQSPRLSMADAQPNPEDSTPLASAYDAEGRCVGILHCLGNAAVPAAGTVWKAEKWFAQSEITQ